jgi:outer membrane autotransporter protein
MAGVDYRLTDKLVVGASLGHEYLDLKTRYNYGGMWAQGVSFTPYLGYSITDQLTVDALVSYTHLWNNVSESPQANSLEINGDFESNRLMAAANVNYRIPASLADTIFSVGYMYSSEWSPSYTARSNNNILTDKNVDAHNAWIGELRAGVRFEHAFAERYVPYAGAYYLYDTTMSRSIRVKDTDAIEFVGGLDAFLTDKLRMGLEVADSCFRKYEYNTRVGLNLRYEW